MGYPYWIVFDPDNLFMPSHIQIWAASKRIKLEPSTRYHLQTERQSEIVNKEIILLAGACEVERIEWLSKMPEIQLGFYWRYNASRQNNHFIIVIGFDI